MLAFKKVDHSDLAAIDIARALFMEYQAELGVDLCFQSFEEELASLPGKYGPPLGSLYLLYDDDQIAGCGALRPLEEGVCELKRIYVRPTHRRLGYARELSLKLLDDARALGYSTAKLDTLARLTGALALYRELGFEETTPYNFNPEDDIVYMQRAL